MFVEKTLYPVLASVLIIPDSDHAAKQIEDKQFCLVINLISNDFNPEISQNVKTDSSHGTFVPVA